jgi:hypothetical protein
MGEYLNRIRPIDLGQVGFFEMKGQEKLVGQSKDFWGNFGLGKKDGEIRLIIF